MNAATRFLHAPIKGKADASESPAKSMMGAAVRREIVSAVTDLRCGRAEVRRRSTGSRTRRRAASVVTAECQPALPHIGHADSVCGDGD
jgi:hypothetical protein